MRYANLIVLFIFITITVILMQNAEAVGISGRSTGYTIDFVPEQIIEEKYIIITNSGFVMDYDINLEGDLAKYATLSDTEFLQVYSAENKEFSVTLKLPKTLEAGLHSLSTCVSERQTRGDGNIGVKTTSCAWINVRVLYDKPYLEFKFYANGAEKGKEAKMNFEIQSWSKQDMKNVLGNVEIYNGLQNIKTLKTDIIELKSNEKRILDVYLDTNDMDYGKYIAKARVSYANEITPEQSAEFYIGELFLNITNHTREIFIKKINKFDVDVSSIWNGQIKDVYAELSFNGEKFKSSSVDINPRDSKTITIFVDGKNLESGRYDAEVKVYYEGKETKKEFILNVKAGDEKGFAINTTVILIGASVILVLALVIVIIVLLLKLRKKEKRKK